MVSPSTQVTQFKPSSRKMSGTARKVRLASSTAFGSPVVPLVKIIASGSSAPNSGPASEMERRLARRRPIHLDRRYRVQTVREGGRPDLLPGAIRIALGAVISPNRSMVAGGRLPSAITAIAPSLAQARTDR